MPKMIVKAHCEQCGEDVKFMEFRKEPCGPTVTDEEREYGFRCLKCATRVPELTDAEGHRHHWVDGEHLEA